MPDTIAQAPQSATYLPAAQRFIDEMRALCALGLPEAEQWDRARPIFEALIRDPSIKAHSETWPTNEGKLGLAGKHSNLLFYEDPDYGFVLNGLIKRPDAKTTVHDHGKSWTLYGIVAGGETVLRYNRTDGGQAGDLPDAATVEPIDEGFVGPGYIDFVPPWEIHAEHNGPERTVGLILRSQRCGTYVQNIFYRDSGAVEQYYGPEQIPHHLG